MFRELQELANEMGLSEGSLLKLARDISHDGALTSVRHMRKHQMKELIAFLEKVSYTDKARAFSGAGI